VSDDPRDALLSVAREIVAKRGYVGLSMRTASAAAGVTEDVALRYYRNREALFAAAMRLPVDPVSAIPALMAPGIEGMGERLVRLTLDTLRDPAARDDLISLARTGVSAGHAVTGLQDFIETGVVDRVAGMIGVPDARMRSALITSYLMGVATMRYGVRLEPLASASDEEVIRMVAPVIQDLLDPRHPIPGSARARARSSAPSAGSAPPPTGSRARTFDPDPAATRRAAEASRVAAEAEVTRAARAAGASSAPARPPARPPAPSSRSAAPRSAGDEQAPSRSRSTKAAAKAATAKTTTRVTTKAASVAAAPSSAPAGQSTKQAPAGGTTSKSTAKKNPTKKTVAKKNPTRTTGATKAPAKKKAPDRKSPATASGPKHAQVPPEPGPSPDQPT
jgi:AcrR family transcriptional regulator